MGRTRRRRKRRNICPVSQEELPNHLKNCSLYSRLSTVDCALQNKYLVFILSLRFLLELKTNSIAYIRVVCHHINCCEFYHFDASVNWNQTQASIRPEPKQKIVFLSKPIRFSNSMSKLTFPKFNKDEKLST